MRKNEWIKALLGAGMAVICLTGCSAAGDREDTARENEVQEEESSGIVRTDSEEYDKASAGNAGNPADGITNEKAGEDDAAAQGDGVDQPTDTEAAMKQLKGLGISVYGDSISTFEGWIPAECSNFYPIDGEVTDVSDTWWKSLIDETGMELCVNNSSAGCTCVGDSTAIDNPAYGCSSARISLLMGKEGRMPEIIIVYMGTNDLLKGVPIGDNDGTRLVEEGEIENFSDAYCMILDKLASEYPIADIYCCTLPQVGDWGTDQPFVTFENYLQLTAADYSEQIRVVAGNKGFKVVDLQQCGIEIDNLQEMSSDGVHLTPEGMKCVKDAVLDAIVSGR